MSESPPEPSAAPSAVEVDVDLWQDTLATEHAVIWSYGLVGATGDLAEAATAELQDHRFHRSVCMDAVVALGQEPVASAPAYEVPKPPSEEAARRLAVELESSAATSYVALVGASNRATRLIAAQWLRESAIAQTRWGGVVPELPGYDLG